MIEWIAAGLLASIGIAHSALGEREVIGPLLRERGWRLATIPRAAADPLLRFAWHLTTLAWWALAAVLVGVPIAAAFAATCLLSAAIILVLLPGHLAWPLFLAAGVLALWIAGGVPELLLWATVAAGALVASIAAGFHAAWALGSSRGVANVIPQDPATGEPKFRPQAGATLLVAFALLAYAALVVGHAAGAVAAPARWAVLAALVILTARVFGDGTWAGVLKRVRDTGFARADDRYWTPAAGLLALGALAALALGA